MGLSVNLLEHEIKKLVEGLRPPVDIRSKLDIGYRFEKKTLEIYEIRPRWNDPSVISQFLFAKAKFIASKNVWKIYWRRSNGKWQVYEPVPEVRQISEFFKLIEEDQHAVFKG